MSFYKSILSNIESLKSSIRPSFQSQKNFNNINVINPKMPSKNERLRKISEALHAPMQRSNSMVNNLTARQVNPSPQKKFSPTVDYLQELLTKEQEKNEKYKSDILVLNRRIDELEVQLKMKGNTVEVEDKRDDNEIIKENVELKKFKENVYNISKQYDEINENIIVSLNEIDRLFQKLNDKNFDMNLDLQIKTLTGIKTNFEGAITNLIDTMKLKQEEYNLLLEEKEKEVQKVLAENDVLKKKYIKSEKEFFEKTAWLIKSRREQGYQNGENVDDIFGEYFKDKPDNVLTSRIRKSESMKNYI